MTTYIADTFTAADGTQLASHTPGTGSGYTLIFGTPATDLTVQSNRLRNSAASSAEFYNSTTLPAIDFYIEIVLRFASSSFCEVELARNGTSFGNGDKFAVLDFFGAGNASIGGGGLGSSASLNAVLTALNTDYTFRVEFATSGADTAVTYKIDGATVFTRTITANLAWFAGPLGFTFFESAGVSVMGWDSLTVADATSPPAASTDFWTSFVGSHEVP